MSSLGTAEVDGPAPESHRYVEAPIEELTAGRRKRGLSTGRSPYLAARREWNAQFGQVAAMNRTLCVVATLAAAAAVLAIGGLVYMGAQVRVVPYIVVMDSSGAVVSSGAAGASSSATDPRVIRAMVSRFIQNLRMVTADGAAQKHAVGNVYAMLSPGDPAYAKISDYYRGGGDPFEIARSRTVSVEVVAILPMSEETFQIEWREAVRDRRGSVISDYGYTGILTTRRDPTPVPEKLVSNPLGIYITSISWARKL